MLWNLDEVYKALDIKKKINENFLFNEISIDSKRLIKNLFSYQSKERIMMVINS